MKLPAGRRRTAMVIALILCFAAAFWFFQQQPRKPVAQDRQFTTKVPVTVAVVGKGAVRDSFAIVGISKAWRDVDILSETSGIVRSVSSEVGQRKSAGAVLLKVDDEVAASALRKATVNRELANRDFERYRNLQQEGAVAQSSYEAMRLKLEDAEADLVAARRRVRDTAVKAPFEGTVTSRLVEIGDLVQPGMKLANMVDLSRVKIMVSVPEKQVALISGGMPVLVTTDVWLGKAFSASVTSVSAKSSKEHTYQVEAAMDNPKQTPFRSGMFARAAFVGKESRQSLLIPRQALVGSIGTPEVFVVRQGIAKLTRLVTGAESGGSIEVLDGLAEGDLVVVSGQNELGDGTAVTVVRQEGAPGR
ncbi:MAG: efflux RND transporter periplasmic adaptor subunit [Chlorobiaceae bacterium]|nr:efflux RND transporter periplasmic adaptor subunit [Chlorobiaceae bacterium]